MSKHEITRSFSNKGTRDEIRMRVVNEFAKEEPGIGRDDLASRYIYYVEVLSSGNRVYLQRPANLHNGFDFLICVENTNYAAPGRRRRNYPTHDDINADLLRKKEDNPKQYSKLYALLKKIYLCNDVTDADMFAIEFRSGFSAEHIAKVLKWFFIEQDIRYWNYSGRAMTWGIVPEP